MSRPKGSHNKPKTEIKSESETESALVIELNSKSKPKPKTQSTEISWETHCKISRAIVLIHNCGRYFEGMQILCELIGWDKNSLLNQFDSIAERRRTREQFNHWIKTLAENP